ncbi:MAG: ribosomal protein S18-alanine N-acetyltransferase [Armatimonadetes bacterium]|nr:ribosomal protein S18-alanine N-acetyltransferase [Armatimonadota bacterium]
MNRDDIHRVMEIERLSFSTPWHESAYLTELVNRSAYYVVARVDDEIVGYSGMWVIMDEAHITTIAVHPNYRGLKIGEQLLVAILEEAQRRGARRATLEVRESNNLAQNLYHKYGFVAAAIRRGYYSDNAENAVVMWVDDIVSRSYQEFLREKKLLLDEEAAEYEERSTASRVAG